MTRRVHIAVLLADTPNPAVLAAHGTYRDVFSELLQGSLARTSAGAKGEVELSVEGFDVVQGVYPSPSEIDAFDAVLITGSAASAYETLPWIDSLARYLKDLADAHPAVRIMGICFGHQVLARGFGVPVERNEKGWEVGTTPFVATEDGQKWLGLGKEVKIQQMHRDHVPSVPEGFTNLGSSPVCANQGFVRLYPTQPPPPYSSAPSVTPSSPVHILTLQGHPEFTQSIVDKIVDARERAGIFDRTFANESRTRAAAKHDGFALGRAALKILGIE